VYLLGNSNSWWSHEVRREITTTVQDYFGWTCGHLQHPPGSLRRRGPLPLIQVVLWRSWRQPNLRPTLPAFLTFFWVVCVTLWLCSFLNHANNLQTVPPHRLFLRLLCIAIATSKQLFGFYTSPIALYIVYILWPLICVPIYIVSSFSAHLKTDGDCFLCRRSSALVCIQRDHLWCYWDSIRVYLLSPGVLMWITAGSPRVHRWIQSGRLIVSSSPMPAVPRMPPMMGAGYSSLLCMDYILLVLFFFLHFWNRVLVLVGWS